MSQQTRNDVVDLVQLNGGAVTMVLSDVYDKACVVKWVKQVLQLLDVELAKDIEKHINEKCINIVSSILNTNRNPSPSFINNINIRTAKKYDIENIVARRIISKSHNNGRTIPRYFASNINVKV